VKIAPNPAPHADELVYDPFDTATARDPHALFKRLRDEAPLYYNPDENLYALSRFDDVERSHIDRETFISRRGVTLGLLRMNRDMPSGTVILEDPPTHGIHRALLSRMFTPRRVRDLEPKIRQLCGQLLDPLVGSGGFDVITELGSIVPMRVIGMLLGIPNADQVALRDQMVHNRERPDEERHGDGFMSGELFADYIDWRAEHPSDDIMTHLLTVEFEDETGVRRRLRREELLAYLNVLAAAGNETTTVLIGWTAILLARYPDQREILLEQRELTPNAVEEILRFESPPLQSCRYVARDVELHGQTLPAGSHVAFLLGSANRDERRIPDPGRFDVTRAPGQHFSFGFGAHYCLGQALARLEGRVVLEELLERFPTWDVDTDAAVFHLGDADLRAWKSLPFLA
jgi:cytochrome P450